MKKIIICVLCLVLLCGCADNTKKQESQKLTIVTTIYPLYDFARAIGGELVEVKMLIKPGSEVHSYDPLPSDMVAVYESDLFVYIGGESEKWVDNLVDSGDVNTLKVIDCVAQLDEHQHHDGHEHADEHIWTSPKNAILMLGKICESMATVDSENADIYRKNCAEYIAQIKEIDAQIASVVDKSENPFIVVADRFPFAYFAQNYGIDYEAAFDGCAVSTDISLKTMSRISNVIKKRGVKTIYCTELSNKSIANALSEEMGVEIVELHSAHNVTLDDFNNNITYVDIMKRNKIALERGI